MAEPQAQAQAALEVQPATTTTTSSQSQPQLTPTGSLSGKVIAITGAASGIGLAVALECARRNAHALALSDLNHAALTTLLETTLLPSFPGTTFTATELNVTSSAAVRDWIAATVSRFGHLDGACNIAGVETLPGTPGFTALVDMTDEHFRFVNDVNLNGVFYCLREELRVMGRGASVVNMSSTAGIKGAPKLGAYAASKHGVVGLTKSAAKEMGAAGVRVNAVCAGPVETPLLRRLVDSGDSGIQERMQGLPLGRLGNVEEVAKGFGYLLSDDSTWTTGTTLMICGGSTA